MNFYRFDTKEQFESMPTPQGVNISVVGLIPDGGMEEDWQEVYASDGGLTLTRMKDEKGKPAFRPTFIAGWHVNTDQPVTEWASFEVTPQNPIRIFA